MTEAEWLASSDPESMIFDVQFDHNSTFVGRERKLRLLGCACCRLMWHDLVDSHSRAAVEVGERYADGLATWEEIRDARLAAEEDTPTPARLVDFERLPAAERVERSAAASARSVCRAEDGWNFVEHARDVIRNTLQVARDEAFGPGEGETSGIVISLIRDIFGPLSFRPVVVVPAWLTSAVTALAQQMYDSRDFAAMPILADALEESGCDNAEILNHCRSDSPHVRGCWVVDLVLGKE